MSSASIGASNGYCLPLKLLRARQAYMLPLALFLFSTTLLFSYQPLTRFETGDNALYDYIAQSILRGQLSYRDVVDVKGPGSTYLSALAMVIGRGFGVRDVIAVRLLHIVFAGLLCAITYAVTEVYLRSRLAAVIAALTPLMVSRYDEFMVAGTEPKLSMMLFGVLSLLMIAKDKPIWAGICSMMACLCWQPGLMFVGVAFVIHSRYLTSWRDLGAARVMIGAALPLAIALGYFYWNGALGDLWSYAIVFNYAVAAPQGSRDLGGSLLHLGNVLYRVFESDRFIILAPSAAGLLMFLIARVRPSLSLAQAIRPVNLFRDAIIIPPLIYLGFCCVNLQGGPDLIPLFPFVGIFAGWFLVEGSRLAVGDRTAKVNAHSVPLRVVIPAVALLVILGLSFLRAHRYGVGEVWTLQREEEEVKRVGDLLGPNDTLFVHGAVELLVLLNRPNLNPYVDLDTGKDNYIAQRKYDGSFKALVDEIESQAPRVVAISRLRNVAHRAELERWVAERYSPLNLEFFNSVSIRR